MDVCKDKEGIDKVIHVCICFCIAVVVGALVAHIPPHKDWVAVVAAFSVALIAGLWKEFHDRKKKGNHFCIWDLVADIAGATAGSCVIWLIIHFINRAL